MKTIFVKLLNENIDVWRPVLAELDPTGIGLKIISAVPENSDKNETWEFSVGSIVVCEEQFLDGKFEQVAIKLK